MNHAHFALPLLVFLTQTTAHAQRSHPQHSLSRAIAVLADADGDKDGRLGAREAGALPVESEEFVSLDLDNDGFWSRDEFLLFYRQKLVASGQPVGVDLETETARIHALRRARQVAGPRLSTVNGSETTTVFGQAHVIDGRTPQARVHGAGPSQRVGSRQGADADPEPTADARLTARLEDLERRAASGQATHVDFEKARGALESARGPKPDEGHGDSSNNDTYRKMLQSLHRLEKSAAEGIYSREEYATLRASIVRRARNIEGSPGSDPGNIATAPGASDILVRLDNALLQLEQGAASAGASREDFERVRAEWIALARSANQAGLGTPARVADPGSETFRKLLRSLERLEARAREGAYTREEYRALREQMVHRARAIIATSPTPIALPTPIGRTGTVPAPPASATPDAGEGALRQTFDDLEKRVASGRAVSVDFQRVRDQLSAHARRAAVSGAMAESGAGASSEIFGKLQAALDRLEQRATEGVYSREEYQALRAQFIHRARSAEQGGVTVEGAGEEGSRASSGEPARPEPKPRRSGTVGGEAEPHPQTPPTPPTPQREQPEEPPRPERPPHRPASGERPRS